MNNSSSSPLSVILSFCTAVSWHLALYEDSPQLQYQVPSIIWDIDVQTVFLPLWSGVRMVVISCWVPRRLSWCMLVWEICPLLQFVRLYLRRSWPDTPDDAWEGPPSLERFLGELLHAAKTITDIWADISSVYRIRLLFIVTRSLWKGGVTLPVLRCARDTTSLEGFHLHLTRCRFIPGMSSSLIHYQSYLLDGVTRWNQDRALAAR